MQTNWVSSIGNEMGSYSVSNIELPVKQPKWILDLVDNGETFEGIDMCILDKALYFLSYKGKSQYIWCVNLLSGEINRKLSFEKDQITQLCLNQDYLVFGGSSYDIKTGEKALNIRDICDDVSLSGVGYGKFFNGYWLKSVSGFDFSKGFVLYDLNIKQRIEIDFYDAPICVGNGCIYGKKKTSISRYDIKEGRVVWECDFGCGIERPAKIASNGDLLVIKNLSSIHFVNVESGHIESVLTESDFSHFTSETIKLSTSARVLCDNDTCVLINDADKDSWISCIDLSNFRIVSFKRFGKSGGACLGGKFLFTTDEHNRPVAYAVPSLELAWVGESPISSHLVIAGGGHVVYAFPGGGFQCYGPPR